MLVLEQRASTIFPEPPGDEAAGFEFTLTTPAFTEYHQVKRQRTGEGRWTVAALAGAGVLKAFYEKLQDPDNVCVFASAHAAYTLEELADRARKATDWSQFDSRFLDSKTWRTHFDELADAWGAPGEWVWDALRRVRVETIGEDKLRDLVALQTELLLDGRLENAVAALVEVLRDRVNEPLTARELWAELEPRGMRPNPWASASLLVSRIDDANERFRNSRCATLIGGELVERRETNTVVAALAERRTVLVRGDAGMGKSDVLLGLCDHLADARTPYLVMRLDRQQTATTPEELGKALGLPGSPSAVLAASAAGGESVLIVDQLDALSTTSGRNVAFLDCIDAMLRRANADPSMRVVLSCRSFDAAHDGRLRRLLDPGDERPVVTVGPFGEDVVRSTLAVLDIDADAMTREARELLAVPLHLALLTELGDRAKQAMAELHTLRDFYDAFWDAKWEALRNELGRDPEWTAVLDVLVDYMSDEQVLHAPRGLVDEWRTDVNAMLSASVLVADGQKLAFFHETFFDYAFARRFTARRRTLQGLLERDQFLFRRSQVRQVLAYGRDGGSPQYARDLEFLLTDADVRFHLQDLVLAWLGRLDPQPAEWQLIEPMLSDAEHPLHDRAWRAVSTPSWFQWLDERGLPARWLAQGGAMKDRALFMVRAVDDPESGRVAALLAPYREASSEAADEVDAILAYADLSKSREIFDLFLRSLGDGGDVAGRDFWYVAAHLPDAHPDWGCELLGAYLRSRLTAADAADVRNPFHYSESLIPSNLHLRDFAVECAERAPVAFVDHVFPQMVAVIRRTSDPPRRGGLRTNPVWLQPHLSDNYGDLDDHLLLGAEAGLRALARQHEERFAALVAEHADTDEESIVYFLYEGFGANPQRFADDAAEFALAAPGRLEVGRSNEDHWATRLLIGRITPWCSDESLSALEQAVLAYFTPWEKSAPGRADHGYAQFTLLAAIDRGRLSPLGRRRLQEWQRKFGADDVPEPEGIVGGMVGSPIPDEATKKMKDWQWLRAMARYSDHDGSRREFLKGGARELANVMEQRVAEDPVRFARLACEFPDDANIAYFEAVLRGVEKSEHDVPLADAQELVERCHRLPERPVGRWIAHPLRRYASDGIPAPLLEIIAWYAAEDPDPAPRARGENRDEEKDRTLHRGLNSVRGGMAYEITRLVHRNAANIAPLEPAIRSLVADPVADVQAMAAEITVGLLRHEPKLAVELFAQLADRTEDRVLATLHAHDFMRYRGTVDFDILQLTIRRMLGSERPEVRKEGAVQAALVALSEADAQPLAEESLRGDAHTRTGVALVYAANVKTARYRARCEEGLRTLFDDADGDVRSAAAEAIERLGGPDVRALEPLVRTFLDSRAFEDKPDVVLRALGEAEPLPAALAIDACRRVLTRLQTPSDLRTSDAAVARNLSDVLVRAYVDAPHDGMRNDALDVIDDALRLDLYGTDRLLHEHDRL
jgi:hypothetical protein